MPPESVENCSQCLLLADNRLLGRIKINLVPFQVRFELTHIIFTLTAR